MGAEQARAALARANEIRSARARWGRRAGELARPEGLFLAAVLAHDCPPWARTWRIGRILARLEGIGPERARRLCHHIGVGEEARLGDLGSQHRLAIAHRLNAEGADAALRLGRPDPLYEQLALAESAP